VASGSNAQVTYAIDRTDVRFVAIVAGSPDSCPPANVGPRRLGVSWSGVPEIEPPGAERGPGKRLEVAAYRRLTQVPSTLGTGCSGDDTLAPSAPASHRKEHPRCRPKLSHWATVA